MIKLCAFSDEADKSIAGQIKALMKNGVSYTEMRSVEGKSVINFTHAETKEYKSRLDDNGIAVWSIGSPLGKVDINVDFCEYEKNIRDVCETAVIFGTDKIRAFSFYNAYSERNKVLDRLNRMVEIAAEYGLKLYHENEKDIYGDIADRVDDILLNVERIGCVYDPANFIQCGEKAEYTLKKLHSRADYFHIKDVIEKTQQIVPAGEGDGLLVKLVADIQGDKVLSVEPHLTVFAGYSDNDSREMKNKYSFPSQGEAFDAAIRAIKEILFKTGYKEINGEFVK